MLIGEILTIAIVLQEATWILREFYDSRGTIAIVLGYFSRMICFYIHASYTLRDNYMKQWSYNTGTMLFKNQDAKTF